MKLSCNLRRAPASFYPRYLEQPRGLFLNGFVAGHGGRLGYHPASRETPQASFSRETANEEAVALPRCMHGHRTLHAGYRQRSVSSGENRRVREPGRWPQDKVQRRPTCELRTDDESLPGALPAARLNERLHRL